MTLSKRSEEKFDRLIDWDASLTPRDHFFDAVTSTDALRIKYGVDITASTLHLGHAVNMRVMREMQDMGHKVVFLLGGFTTLVGDPTDRTHARGTIDELIIEENKRRFIGQVATVLDFDDPNKIEIRDNTEWWGDAEHPGTISPYDLFSKMLRQVSLGHLSSRAMFRKRLEEGQPIQMAEFLYPVLQGYDSVMVESDVTVVGTDQLFNENMGRFFQEEAGQPKQMIVCTKITPGLDGGPKQSKSIGNFVGIDHSPQEKYDRLMRLRDDLTGQWLRVYSDIPLESIQELEERYANDPIVLKQMLAHNVVAGFHGQEVADQAREEFGRKLNHQAPTDMPEVQFHPGMTLRQVLMERLGYKSGQIRQFIENGSIQLVGSEDDQTRLTLEAISKPLTAGADIKIGKSRYFRLTSDA